ncbi:substrate-binding periplasmic protein [Thalassotalea euphylliae]|uniref:substrate-binding periplasmic protein n=1 Tax=Thalassotalea euphylliae TaxID=1655234 RepID=UPI00363B47E3
MKLVCQFMIYIVVMLVTTPRVWAEQVTVHVVTEDAYPLQYMEGGELKGPATDVIVKVLERAQLDYRIDVLPWARAYTLATTKPNTLIFSIARTQPREDAFHWIGALMKLQYFFYGHEDQFPENAYQAEQFKHMRIGGILESATYQYLRANGFERLYHVANPSQNYDKLLSGRIDLFTANVASFKASCVKFNKDCSQIKPIAPVGIPATQLYFALSKNTSQDIVDKIRKAYQQLRDEGEIVAEIALAFDHVAS